MIVCNCKAASERDVHSAIQRGAESLSDLKRCGIGGDCGSCHNALRALLGGKDVGMMGCPAHPASFIPTSLHPNIPTDTLAP